MPNTELTKKWEQQCSKFLKGKTIESVRYLTEDEAERMGWFHKPLVIIFTDGEYIFSSQDDEGNDGGALFTSDDKLPTIPVMR